MTFVTRLKYLLGMLIVVAAVAALAITMNNRISTVQDLSATVKSRAYTVGTDYTGVLVHAYVRPGEAVTKGEPLFVVKSSQLGREVRHRAVKPSKSAYEIRDHNELVIRATEPGKVVRVPHIAGSYVEAGDTLARIQKLGTSYVQAEFRLSAKEYGLIRTARTATIILPDQRALKARITAVRVRTRGKTAVTQLRARTPRLDNRGLFATGTPLRVQVRLPRHNLLDQAEHTLHGLLTPGATR